MKANITETPNYNAFETAVTTFTIAKAKLATPENLRMGASGTASYGLIKWDNNSATNAPKRDGNGEPVRVTYKLELYKVVNGTN